MHARAVVRCARAFSFSGPAFSASSKTATSHVTRDVPSGTGARIGASTVRLLPLGFTAAAESPLASLMKPKTEAASTARARLFVAVALIFRHLHEPRSGR